MTREEYKKEIFGKHSSTKVYKSAKKYIASLEAQLKDKEKEIEKLRTLLMQSNRESVLIGNKIGESKARSIVAMLFWSGRKYDRTCGVGTEQANTYGIAFREAHAMLKDNK